MKKKGSKKKGTKKKPSKKKKGKKVAPKSSKKAKNFTRVEPKGAYLTKGEFLNNFCAETNLGRKQGRSVMEAIGTIGLGELKKGRKFVIPGIARFVVKNRPATKARKGINPFTKEPCVFKAKPASKKVRAAPMKLFRNL